MQTLLFTLATHSVIGGVTSRQVRLARLLAERGWRCVFALTWGNRFHDPFAFRKLFPDIETVLLDGRSGTREGRLLTIQRAVRTIRPKIVLPGALQDVFEFVRVEKQRAQDIRLLYGLPGIHPAAFAWLRRFEPIIDQAFGVSRLTVNLLKTVVGISPERIHYIPTGVTPASIRAVRPESGPIRLGYVGRFDADKRVLDLIELCRQMDLRNLNYELTVVGQGTLDVELRTALAPWVSRSTVRILGGMTPNSLYRDVYPQLDACLLFSPMEGLPNTLIEAMSHGVASITSDFHGRKLQGLIRHGETGLVFPVGDLIAAAECVAALSNDRHLHQTLCCAGRKAVGIEHSVHGMADAFVELLDLTMNSPPCRGCVDIQKSAPAGRLTKWLGPRMAERCRSLLGRRFIHPDPSEWPLIENYCGPEISEFETRTDLALRDADDHGNLHVPTFCGEASCAMTRHAQYPSPVTSIAIPSTQADD